MRQELLDCRKDTRNRTVHTELRDTRTALVELLQLHLLGVGHMQILDPLRKTLEHRRKLRHGFGVGIVVKVAALGRRRRALVQQRELQRGACRIQRRRQRLGTLRKMSHQRSTLRGKYVSRIERRTHARHRDRLRKEGEV